MTKAVKLTLTDGRELLVREPGATDLGLFLQAMPAINLLQRAMSSVDPNNPIVGVMPELPEPVMARLHPLLAVVCGLTPDEYSQLGLLDGLAVFTAFLRMIPTNFTPPTISSD